MRALLINCVKESVREIAIKGDVDSICDALAAIKPVRAATLPNGDQVYIDGDLFIETYPPVACFFLDADLEPPTIGPEPGPALVVGMNGDAVTSLAELTSRTMFSWCRYWPGMGVGLYQNKAEAIRG